MLVLCYAAVTTGIISKCIISLPKQTANELSERDKSQLKTKLFVQSMKGLKIKF